MKLRNGFVSNSSTSSFIVLCKAEDYNKALDIATKGSPLIREAITSQVFGKAEEKADEIVYGQPLKHFSYSTCNWEDFPCEDGYGRGEYCDPIPVDENGKNVPKKKRPSAENVSEAVGKLIEEVRKLGGFAETGYE